ITNAILIWSEHFTVTLLHAPPPDRRRSAALLGLANVGVAAVLYGAAAGPRWLAAIGAAVLCAAVIWHLSGLVRMRGRALPGPFSHVAPWYIAAAGMLVAGGVLGGLLVTDAAPPALHERLHGAHVQVN